MYVIHLIRDVRKLFTEKGQGIVEYSMLLALFAVVGYFMYASGMFAYTRMYMLNAFYGIISTFSTIN